MRNNNLLWKEMVSYIKEDNRQEDSINAYIASFSERDKILFKLWNSTVMDVVISREANNSYNLLRNIFNK